ncbi:MAG: hypothetical protein [Caudoviricetes sp.]|nr:MAG: hypothetical protein [Caudoviricetes sp.]
MYDQKNLKIWQALELVKKRVAKNAKNELGDYREAGICNAVDIAMFPTSEYGINDFDRHSEECFKAWEHFSGNSSYPVPCPTGDSNGEAIAFHYSFRKTMWHKRTKYGAMRWALLEHCINWFKERNI